MTNSLDRRSIGRSALWSIIEGGASQLLGLAVFLVTAHYVAPEAYGVLATALLLINLFREVVLEGFVAAVNRQAHPTDEDYNACFFLVAGVSALLALSTYLLRDTIASWVPIEHFGEAIPPVCVLLMTFGLSRAHEAYLSRHFQFRSLALRSMFSILIGGTIGIIMAVHGFGLWSLITQQLVTALVALAILWRACPWRPRLRFSRASILRILGFAQHVSMTGIMNFANNQADIAITSFHLGATHTGHYNAAKRIGTSLNLLMANSLGRVVMPTLAKVQQDPARIRRVFFQAVSLTTTLTAPVFAGLIGLAPDAVYVAMGARWGGVAPILMIISITYFLMTVQQYNQNIFFVIGKPYWQTLLMAVSAISNVILMFIFVRWGVLAIAAAYTIRAVVISPLSINVALRMINGKWHEYCSAFFPATIAAGVMGFAIAMIRLEMLGLAPILRILVLVPTGAAIYSALLWMFHRKSLNDLLGLAQQTFSRAPH